jgi:hypothetical protein
MESNSNLGNKFWGENGSIMERVANSHIPVKGHAKSTDDSVKEKV